MIRWKIEYNATGKHLKGEAGVRRLICYSKSPTHSNLKYKGDIIAFFDSSTPIDITFESYYGFPRISDFSFELDQSTSIIVLIDTVPYSDVSDNYFEEGVVT
jgi:hypothetical protein|nr:MAG TPA: hypothetical protein [Bacteriophage sp.]